MEERSKVPQLRIVIKAPLEEVTFSSAGVEHAKDLSAQVTVAQHYYLKTED